MRCAVDWPWSCVARIWAFVLESEVRLVVMFSVSLFMGGGG